MFEEDFEVYLLYDFDYHMLTINMEEKRTAVASDFAVALGCMVSSDDNIGYWYLATLKYNYKCACANSKGKKEIFYPWEKCFGLRPLMYFDKTDMESTFNNRIEKEDGSVEVLYGEYPQYAVDEYREFELEKLYQSGELSKTGKKYTIDSNDPSEFGRPFSPKYCNEYLYEGKKYVRVPYRNKSYMLHNGKTYNEGDNVWIEISPLVWYIDDEDKTLFSKNILTSGFRFNERYYMLNFYTTEAYEFLNDYFKKDIIPSKVNLENLVEQDKIRKEKVLQKKK